MIDHGCRFQAPKLEGTSRQRNCLCVTRAAPGPPRGIEWRATGITRRGGFSRGHCHPCPGGELGGDIRDYGFPDPMSILLEAEHWRDSECFGGAPGGPARATGA